MKNIDVLRGSQICVSLLLMSALTVGACTRQQGQSVTAQQAVVDYDLLLDLPTEPISMQDDIQPILDKRCVVCHGCFDAPCQLKLSSYEGVTRGANVHKVYDGGRVRAVEPTRLYIDGKTTGDWRGKNFFPVLNEVEGTGEPEENLHNSVLYRMLRLKQLNPQPRTGMLPDSFDLQLDRAQVCTQIGGFDDFAQNYPLWGMPYAMPNLADREYDTLVQWLAQGSPKSPAKEPSDSAVGQIESWEAFLNGSSNKERLMSRYLYEHLFLGHIHLEGTGPREFYRLIRSTTPPGEPADEIATVRPYDDPGMSAFYYRLIRYQPSIVAKSHVVYELSAAKMSRYRELFLDTAYDVAKLPDYEPVASANPFVTFAVIPPNSRYRFLLDDAKFFIEGFIKGPVCRGQIALNVIDDQFWVMFFNPDLDIPTEHPDFLSSVADDLMLPAARGNTLNLLAIWTDYRKRQRRYINARDEFFKQIHAVDLDTAMNAIWNGKGDNPNAALTVFRHFDSATVVNGFIGDYPRTAWIID